LADLLLGGDFSYRYTAALRHVHDLIRSGELGRVFAIDLTFHNAYGPDKSWFYDVRHSGGGCLLDLGIHLVDFIHWTFDEPVAAAHAQLFANGVRLPPDAEVIEDFAIGTLGLASGIVARLACSWRVSAGCDAQIGITVYGTKGGAAFRNVNGSFYDFVAERFRGTATERLCSPPDAWGGRAVLAWVRQLVASPAYDPAIETAVRAAATLDLLYGRPVDPADTGLAAFTAGPRRAARAVSALP
jgi:predicted dehydrogenase